jgi:hypothetical protein
MLFPLIKEVLEKVPVFIQQQDFTSGLKISLTFASLKK